MTVAAFPVVYSTLATNALVSRVLSCYEIGAVSDCRFWHRGLSDVYLVTTQAAQYVLRVSHCHWRSQADIDFELELLDFLHQYEIPVAYPLRTTDGRLAIEIDALEGKRYAALFIYAPGTVALGDLSPSQSYKLGETIARLHQVSLHFRTQARRQCLTLEYLLDASFQAIAPFLQHRPQHLDVLTETIAQIKQQLQHFPQEPPFWTVCWGDPHSGNAHFTDSNAVTLFDFDQCGYGWRAFEIAKFLQVCLCTGISPNVRTSFQQGYYSVQPLADPEVASLQPFTQTAHIWVWAISLNQAMLHNYSRLDDSYFHYRLEHLKMLKSPEWQLF